MSSKSTDVAILRVPGPDGRFTSYRSPIGRARVAEMMPFLDPRRAAPGIHVCQHPPVSFEGEDLWARFRAASPGHFRYVGCTMFETDRIDPSWVPACNAMDEVWVPTQFNFETFTRSGVDPDRVRVLPFGVPEVDPATPTTWPLDTTRSFRFLSVFELTRRKGWDVLIRAWIEAFRPEDDVALVIKTYCRGPRRPVEILAEFIASLGHDPSGIPEIVLIEDHLTDDQLRSLYRQCQAFVLPSRGEGWGMPYLDALATGLPVIATRWSGQLEFLNDDNAFLIDLDGLTDVDEEQIRVNPFFRGHRWAEPSAACTAELLRRVRHDAAERSRRAARGLEDVARDWTMAAAARRVARRIDEISAHRARLLPPSRRPAPPVRWRSLLWDPSGYASEARAFLSSLAADHDLRPAVEPLVLSKARAGLDPAERALFHALTTRPPGPVHVEVQHILASHFRRRPDVPVTIGRTMFETDRIPAPWVPLCNAMDEIWVPCRHNLATFERSGVAREKLVLIPGTLDFARFDVEGLRHPLIRSDRFTFLSVFDFGVRKGWDVLLEAYVLEFAGRTDVELALRTGGDRTANVEKVILAVARRFAGGAKHIPPFRVLPPLPESEMPALFRSADAFVLPTRGEGFGRPFLEAMAAGTPVIGTAHGGNLDFMTAANSWLIRCVLRPVPEAALREVPNYRGHRWADPDADHLRTLMRRVFEDRAEARRRARAAAEEVRDRLAPSRVTALIRDRLEHWLARAARA